MAIVMPVTVVAQPLVTKKQCSIVATGMALGLVMLLTGSDCGNDDAATLTAETLMMT